MTEVPSDPNDGVLTGDPSPAGENAGLRDDAGEDGASGLFELRTCPYSSAFDSFPALP
jgi:hypothetical protein